MSEIRERLVGVVADDMLLGSLCRVLGGAEHSGDCLKDGGHLVVYAHALTADGRRRVDSGLKRLQLLLAHPSSSMPDSITVLSFAEPEELGRYSYLAAHWPLVSFAKLPAREAEPRTCNDDDGNGNGDGWLLLTRAASEEELEIQCAAFRHDLRSLAAAARVYLGAAIAGHIEPDRCARTLENLAEMAARDGFASIQKPERLLASLRDHQRFRQSYRSRVVKPDGVKLWALDDHWEDHGWGLFFEDLLGQDATGFTEWRELETRVASDGERPDILCLDCNLGAGDDKPTGLQLLRPLRDRWPEVRVIFATAYDDAALSLASLREGANLFFAKALNDAADRRSLDYYDHVTELLAVCDAEREVAALWRSFRQKTCGLVGGGGALTEEASDHLIRLGFYVLFSLAERNLWWRGAERALPDSYLFATIINIINVAYPSLKSVANAEFSSRDVARILRGCAHGGAKPGLADLRKVFEYLFDKLEDRPPSGAEPLKPWARPKPEHWPYHPRALQTDSTHPGLPAGAAALTHDAAEDRGAVEFARGVVCGRDCRHPVTTAAEVLDAHLGFESQEFFADVAVVDDGGMKSGWFTVARAFLPGCMTFEDSGQLFSQVFDRRARINLVVLDLRLPTHHEGLAALGHILEHDPSVPVLTFSASHDSLAAIRSLRAGALDFVSKSLPGARDLDGCFQFAEEFLSKCRLLQLYGRSACRGHLRALHLLRANARWDSEERFASTEKDLSVCEEHKRRVGGREPLQVPPPLDKWVDSITEELTLLLHLRRQVFWMENEEELPPDERFDAARVYRVCPVDAWRWEHILSGGSPSDFIKLAAVLCGIIIDRLSSWNWSLEEGEALNPYFWGSNRPNSIAIVDEVKKFGGGEFVWRFRNRAMHPRPGEWVRWDSALCDQLIDATFEFVCGFLEWWGMTL